MAQVERILKAIDPKTSRRLGDCAQDIEPVFIQPSERHLQASTIRNNLLSLKKYCDFVMLHELPDLNRDEHKRLTRQIEIWSSSFTKDTATKH